MALHRAILKLCFCLKTPTKNLDFVYYVCDLNTFLNTAKASIYTLFCLVIILHWCKPLCLINDGFGYLGIAHICEILRIFRIFEIGKIGSEIVKERVSSLSRVLLLCLFYDTLPLMFGALLFLDLPHCISGVETSLEERGAD